MKNFSGLTITGATSDGYSVKATGYVKGSWLQSSVMQNYGSNTGKVCVFDNSGWIYYRTPAEILAEAGGGASTEVVQTTGTSTTSVMSQKAVTDELGKKANSADLAKVATSGSYNDLANKPTIPTVNNGTLTIQQNGTKVQTFTANQSTNTTANITVPTQVSELTNDSGYITSNGSVKSVIDYNDASKNIKIGYQGAGISGDSIRYIAGYTTGDSESVARIKDIDKASMKNWLGYATVATSGSYNDLSNAPAFSLSGTTLTITI